MIKITRFILLALILISVTTACNPYQKMLNNPDVAAKYKAAEAYYNTGEYRRANRLYEHVSPMEGRAIFSLYANLRITSRVTSKALKASFEGKSPNRF